MFNRLAKFTGTYKESSEESSEDDENFEDGLNFETEANDPLETVEEIRRRSLEAAEVNSLGQALSNLQTDQREGEGQDHFSPVRVHFPVNAPALRPPVQEQVNTMVNYLSLIHI